MDDAPLTVSILKELLKEQTNEGKQNIAKLENNLKEKIKNSEKHVKEHLEKEVSEVKKDVSDLKESSKKNNEDIHNLRKENDRGRRLRNLVIFKIPEDEFVKLKSATTLIESSLLKKQVLN